MYSRNILTPIVAFTNPSVIGETAVIPSIPNSNLARIVPYNNETAIIKDLGDFDINNLICGARFGAGFKLNSSKGGNLNRRVMSYYNLFNPNTFGGTDVIKANNKEYVIQDNNIYKEDTAQAFVNENNYFNTKGYWSYITNSNDKISVDHTPRNAQKYVGQKDNVVSTIDKNQGEFELHTCVYLQKGETINIELLMPYYRYGEECDWYEYCEWKHRQDQAANTHLSFDFAMALISNDENYKPTPENPIKATEGSMQVESMTNIYSLLPDMTCNDYLKGLCETFNLKISKTSQNEYTIDYYSLNEKGNIIRIDDFGNVKDAKFNKITQDSSITRRFKVDTNEFGYVFEPNHYSGEFHIENPMNTSGSENKYESPFSYTWYKKIKFYGDNLGTLTEDEFQNGVDVPIIVDYKADDYSSAYEANENLGYDTNKNIRFFYINDDKYIICKILNENFKFPICEKTYENFTIDFNNICKEFFNFTFRLYDVELNVKLPNFIYSQINKNTQIYLNQNLYSIEKIEGFNVNNGSCTVYLLPYKDNSNY